MYRRNHYKPTNSFAKYESKWKNLRQYRSYPGRKYRIGIYPEPIRTIPIHSNIYIWANANHSEPIRITFCISFDEKRSQNNPILSKASIRMNPNQVFNPNKSELGLVQTEFSIRINPNHSDLSKLTCIPEMKICSFGWCRFYVN